MHRVRIFENIRGSSNGHNTNDNLFLTIIRPIMVELIGTFLLVMLVVWGGCGTEGNIVQGALCAGCTLMVLFASFSHISGAHLNPCVTLGVFIAGEVRLHLAIMYVIMQIIGGIGAAGMLRLIVSQQAYITCNGGATLLNNGDLMTKWWQGLIIEFFITFLLVTVILSVALDTKSKTGLASLLIGFTLVGNILAAGSYTGASMNPARSLGPAIIANKWRYHWIYWIGPLLGSGGAGLIYRFIWAHHDRRWPKPKPKKINETTVVSPIE